MSSKSAKPVLLMVVFTTMLFCLPKSQATVRHPGADMAFPAGKAGLRPDDCAPDYFLRIDGFIELY